MAVAVAAGTLRTLHRMHQQLADLAEQLAAGPRAVAARTKQVQAADAKKAAAQDDIKKAKMAADQKQLQLKSAEAKILDLEAKLNACKTNREYQTLGDQIAADKMATKVLEDEIIEALERIDALKPAVPAAEAEIDAAKKLLAAAQEKVQAETGRLELELARIKGDLQLTEKELTDDVREKYDRVVKQKGADGLAAVDGDSCGGCFQQLTGNMVSDLMLGRVIACRSCGRLLYMPHSSPSA
ncbi:MAG: phospholipase [Planctomycetia bacterium]|nr:phospholipase [Planctomycetia bacterium]